MRLYHGSKNGIVGVIRPESRAVCDFGKGFYLGTESKQPLTLICSGISPRLYAFDVDLDGLSVYRFDPDVDWALFVAYNRNRMPTRFRKYFAPIYREILKNDVIVGKIANDKIFYVLDFFFDNLASDTALVKCLSALNLGDQYCLKTPVACRRAIQLTEKSVTAAECKALQLRAETQRKRATKIADDIMDANRRDGLLFKDILEKRIEELSK